MIEPVAMADFFVAFFAGAMVILCGALYALLFALARVRSLSWLMLWAYLGYGGLVLAVLTLSRVTHLDGLWRALTVTMLVGYLLAPHAIWQLCTGTHAEDKGKDKGVPSRS